MKGLSAKRERAGVFKVAVMLEQLSYAIVLVGPPGCGKGTQASLLYKEKGFFPFSTGDCIRQEIASGSDLGAQLKEICDAGGLVADDLILDMTQKAVDRLETNKVLFDGFPRTLEQAKKLSALLQGAWKLLVLYFSVEDDVVCDRILGRFSCERCGQGYNDKTLLPKVGGVCDSCGSTNFVRRTDDNVETIRKRLATYKEATDPIVRFYKDAGRVVVVDAAQDISDVWQAVSSSVDAFLHGTFE